jgi:SAM-dependent methyltransferase
MARRVLGVHIHELTTYFRVFDVATLRQLPLRYVAASGYSYGVELIYHLRKAGVALREVPIHFVDRTRGTSKIPRLQIIRSVFDLLLLGLQRLKFSRDLQPDVFLSDPCANCHDRVLAMKHFGVSNAALSENQTAHEEDLYRCTSVGDRTYPPVYTCLHCGLEQVPTSAMPQALKSLYENVIDSKYLENSVARERTYRKCFDKITRYLPSKPGKLAEVGSYCGLFLKEAERRGWQAVGVEPSIWASNYAREVTRVDVHQGYLSENMENLDKDYDLVISWDVLEHVQDPTAFLTECSSLLSDGGIFCISTLDVENWMPRFLGKRWPWLMNMHLFYFSRRSIENVFHNAGLEIVCAHPYVHFARLRYFISGASRALPTYLSKPIGLLANLIPNSFVIPVSFGDIKMYVLKKRK